MRVLDPEVIQQADDVIDECVAVLARVMRLVAHSVTAKVRCDDAVFVVECIDHAWLSPLRFDINEAAMNQDHRLTVARSLIDVADLDAVGVKELILGDRGRDDQKIERDRAEQSDSTPWS